MASVNVLSKTGMNDKGDLITTTIYPPIGVSHDLQKAITDLMHQIVMNDGTTTLAELGYLHMNSICFVNGAVEAKIYFAPELALQTSRTFGTYMKSSPNPKLNIFQNYLFVGSLEKAISFDTITAPKYIVEDDDLGKPSIYLKGKKMMEDKEVLVLHCNPDMLMAAVCDIHMSDPNFTVKYETVGKGDKDKENESGAQIMISAGAKQEFPVRVTVTGTYKTPENDVAGYDPTVAVHCLLSRFQNQKEAIATRNKLAQKASENAVKAAKKRSSTKDFAAYRKFR